MKGSIGGSVDVLSVNGKWVVRVCERELQAERNFERAEHADSFAAGQRIRLGLFPSRCDIPQRSYLVTAR
jgi:hypothetical protein